MRSYFPCLLLALGIGCAGVPATKTPEPENPVKRKGCAIIVTDDDIPSGSATAGALYVSNAALGKLRIKRSAKSSQKRKMQPPAVSHRWMAGRVLVTRVRRLWGDETRIARQLQAGVKRLKRAKALIIDLRGNGGGNDALAFDYVAKIIPRKIPLGKFSLRMSPEVMRRRPHYEKIYTPDPRRRGYSKWRASSVEPKTTNGFAGPIAVVIDKGCYSSCEGFALALKNSGRARLFGQNTGGGSANPILIKLPRTGDKLMIPTWIQIMPDGDLLEDNGVPPDVRLPKKRSWPAAVAYVKEQLLR